MAKAVDSDLGLNAVSPELWAKDIPQNRSEEFAVASRGSGKHSLSGGRLLAGLLFGDPCVPIGAVPNRGDHHAAIPF